MIITLTGKPCSGKGTVGKLFCEKYNFEFLSTGQIFRELTAKHKYKSILEFQQKNENITDVDKQVDNKTIEIGKTRLNDNILFDSRLAWHFIPKSFKVFLDVDWFVAGDRLVKAERENENVENIEEAIDILKARWNEENSRYKKLYNVDNTNPSQYDLVITSTDKTPEQIVEIIYKNYEKFIKNQK